MGMILAQNNNDTEWRRVPGWGGAYYASADGAIASTKTQRILTPCVINSGYYAVRLTHDGKSSLKTVHRLVAAAFLGECPQKLIVNHKNGLKTDNRASNLEYVTKSQNALHGLSLGLKRVLRGAQIWNAKLRPCDIIAIRERSRLGEKNLPIAKDYNTTRQYVGRIVARQVWAHV